MGEDTSAKSLLNTTLVAEAWANTELAMIVVDDGHYMATNGTAFQLTGDTHEELTSLRAGRDLAGDEPSTRIYHGLAWRRWLHSRA